MMGRYFFKKLKRFIDIVESNADDGHEEDEGGGEGRWILILLPEQHASVVFQGYIFTQTGQYDDAKGK